MSAPRRSIWASMRPRIPVHIDGIRAHIVVSEITIMSQLSRSARLRSKPTKCGEPDSSSPSIRNFSETGGAVPGGRGAGGRGAGGRGAGGARAGAVPAGSPRPGKPAGRGVQEDLALVVRGAPAEDLAIALGGLERRGMPLLEGLHGLDVVVTVDENSWRARIRARQWAKTAGWPGELAGPVSQISTVGNPMPVRCPRHCAEAPTRRDDQDRRRYGMASHDLSWSKNSRALLSM